MAKKSKKKNSRKYGKSIWYIILLVVLAAGIYFYNTNPSFRSKCDSTYQQVMHLVDPDYEIPGETEGSAYGSPAENSPATETSSGQEKASASGQTVSAQEGYIYLPETMAFPECAAKNHAKDHQRRDYDHYSICYRETYEQAEWSAYCLDDTELVKNAGRSDDFREDPEITTGSATLQDYKGSGYDRGHLSPAADFAFDKKAMSETFYMSNMSPQAGSFNRGIWKDLESNVRDWAKKFGRVYVISGPVLDEPADAYATIGASRVSIPKYYYKVLLAPLYENDADKATKDDAAKITAIAFILPNKKCDDSYFNYAVSIDEVEKRTGIDFFAGLDDSLENKVEAGFDLSLWK